MGYGSEHDFASGIRRLQCESQLNEVKRFGPKVSIGHGNIQSDDAQNNNNFVFVLDAILFGDITTLCLQFNKHIT